MQTTFEQLQKIVEPHLKAYKEDLTKHDFNILSEYNGPFVYGFRHTGTDLLKLLPKLSDYTFKDKYCSVEDARKILKEDIIWITYNDRNTKFLYFDGKKFKEVSKERITQIYMTHIDKICSDALIEI